MKKFFNIINISIISFVILIIIFVISNDYVVHSTNNNYKLLMISATLITLLPILYYINRENKK